MTALIKSVERVVVLSLLAMMMVAVVSSTIELARILATDLLNEHPAPGLLSIDEMLEIFGLFLMVLIGIELLETIKAYLEEDVVHAEVVVLVAIVAIARKIVVLDYKDMSPEMLLSIGVVILALAGAFYLIKRALFEYPRRTPRSAPTTNESSGP